MRFFTADIIKCNDWYRRGSSNYFVARGSLGKHNFTFTTIWWGMKLDINLLGAHLYIDFKVK